MAEPAAVSSVALAAAAITYFSGSLYQRGAKASATPTIGSLRCVRASGLSPPVTGKAVTATTAMPT